MLSRAIANKLWEATKFLEGSTSKTVPYELVFALHLALKEWGLENAVVTTAFLQDRNYSFLEISSGDVLRKFYEQIVSIELIQIELPFLYRHRPLYNVALYHELGHFLDTHYKIVGYSRLIRPCEGDEDAVKKEINHRMEYFADLIAASYTGCGFYRLLENIAPNAKEASTHPSTEQRLENITNFLHGDDNEYINLFNGVLALRGLPSLERRFTEPDIESVFENVRPYQIQDDSEVHGILSSAWKFSDKTHSNEIEHLNKLGEFESDRIINDLVEKSIRNRMIAVKWNHGTVDEASAG